MLIDVSTKTGYLIACAMRGPDITTPFVPTSALKFLTTAVLRHFVGAGSLFGPVVASPAEAKQSWKDMEEVDRAKVRELWNSPDWFHFVHHFHSAVTSMRHAELTEYLNWLAGVLR